MANTVSDDVAEIVEKALCFPSKMESKDRKKSYEMTTVAEIVFMCGLHMLLKHRIEHIPSTIAL